MIDLPKPISAYFQADTSDGDAVAACFTENAIVKDEGNTYSGRETIRRWKTDSSAKYTYTVEPFAIATEGDKTVVTSHLVGNFPGSPVDLRYFFVFEGDKIAELEIIL
ncbi:polyketide cyclase (plasmid) [Mesorhizobium sp. 131-2-5]|uniref:nuclear transport factor 2 family protein n=1 Tax=Mesorhizobium sp. 131-2-5 TaxID=2744519 RepID=UPI0018EAE2BF|nr:nuclear transport factor 2 family protein [Mesorhizobium sp. 131-2-5]BCH05053.1 polyketide cyclase [Mesorhizobium sp. 131-2-5]